MRLRRWEDRTLELRDGALVLSAADEGGGDGGTATLLLADVIDVNLAAAAPGSARLGPAHANGTTSGILGGVAAALGLGADRRVFIVRLSAAAAGSRLVADDVVLRAETPEAAGSWVAWVQAALRLRAHGSRRDSDDDGDSYALPPPPRWLA